jgi:DNA polymerase-1
MKLLRYSGAGEMADTAERPKLVLIDGHALAFRAFFALESAALRTSQGEPTYAVFGFLQILLTMFDELHPEYVAVAFDVGRTFRNDMYADYKAGRREPPEEFRPQLATIQRVIAALNIPIYTAQGYEADDVIGTLARQATDAGLHTVILTGDTDVLQLVDEHVHVLMANPYGRRTTTTLYDLEQVRTKYKGLHPHQLADLRGLKGDKSDNLPGVQGVGDKGAIDMLNAFGTVDNLFAHLDDAPKRYRKALEGQHDTARLSRDLAVIRCDVPEIQLDVEAARLDDYDRSTVISILQELEFSSSLVQRLPVPASAAAAPPPTGRPAGDGMQMQMFPDEGGSSAPHAPPPPPPGDYHSVTTADELAAVVAELEALPPGAGFAFDIESTGLELFQGEKVEMVGVSLAVREGHAWYIPFGHREGAQLDQQQVLEALRPFLADAQRPTYAFHAKFDIELLNEAGIPVHGLHFDSLLAAKLLGKQGGLKQLAFSELKLDEPLTEISDLIGSGAKQTTFDTVPVAQATPYAAADADMTLRLTARLRAELAQPEHEPTKWVFEHLEMPLLPVIIAMEQAGIGFDTAYMQRLSRTLGERLAEVEEQIFAEAGGRRFNINSGIQLGEVLFEQLKLPTAGLNRTSTGRYSLTADALEKLHVRLQESGEEHAIVPRILRYRQLAKLKSTYVDALPDLVNPRTGRIHTSFNQLGTATGRLSSSNPNLQNIPVRTEEGSEIRRAFIAREGHIFLAADYSQIELRVLAHITQDSNLVQTFQERRDIHAATAAQLFGIEQAQVDKNQRRIAKTVVFGVIYGISSFGLAQRTDLSREEAQALIDALFARFPGIRMYIDETLEQGRRQGYVASLFGRRRPMPGLHGKGPARQAAEREAINAPIQATAADIMKLAMIEIARQIEQRGLASRMLLQVHDELIFEVPHTEIDTMQGMVRELMEGIYTLRVPLSVNIAQGSTWEEMEEVAAPV